MQTSAFSTTSRTTNEIAFYLGGLGMFMAMWYFFTHGQLNLIFAIMIGGVFLLLSLVDKARAAMLTIAYLILMGDIRRIVSPISGVQKLDMLLVIGPAVACFMALPILLKVTLKDRLSKAMFGITVIMVLQIFNPKQGGVSVGLTGVVFNLAPILWFWVGRRYATDRVMESFLYRILLPLAFVACVLGFFQTYIGFLPYEQAWIDSVKNSYTSLFVTGYKARAFGFSVSAAEYANLLSIGGSAAVAAWWGRHRIWIFTFPLFAVGVFLASGRGVVVKFILAIALVFVLRKGKRFNTVTLLRLSFASLAALLLLNVGASLLPESDSLGTANQSAFDQALAHQASGLAHPLDSRYSTARDHGGMFLYGVLEGVKSPLGRGLGATSNAAGKYGVNGESFNSEIDISDMFACLGFAGGLFYLYMVLGVMRSLFIYTSIAPRTISLPVLAILASSLGSWLIGAQYSSAAIMFFLIGGVVHKNLQLAANAERERAVTSPRRALVAVA